MAVSRSEIIASGVLLEESGSVRNASVGQLGVTSRWDPAMG